MAHRPRTIKNRQVPTDDHHTHLQQSLDRYGVMLIKVVGVVGVIIGLVILIAFWYWLLRKLFTI
jgi:hypothetical protein